MWTLIKAEFKYNKIILSVFFSLLVLAMVIMLVSGCGKSEDEPSTADRAIEELQQRYEDLTEEDLEAPVQWATEDLENIVRTEMDDPDVGVTVVAVRGMWRSDSNKD